MISHVIYGSFKKIMKSVTYVEVCRSCEDDFSLVFLNLFYVDDVRMYVDASLLKKLPNTD